MRPKLNHPSAFPAADKNPEIAPFTWFQLRLPGGHDSWNVHPTSANNRTLLRQQAAAAHEKRRQANLARYIATGYAFDERAVSDPNGGVGREDSPAGEWDKFFEREVA